MRASAAPLGFSRVLAELVAVLRRAGLDVSPVEAIDVQRAAIAVGLGSREDLRAALRAVVVVRPEQIGEFDRSFDAFFRAEGVGQGTFFERLAAAGFKADELDALRGHLREAEAAGASGFGAIAAGGGDLERLLQIAGRDAGLERMQSNLQIGFFAARLLEHAGLPKMESGLAQLRQALREALGERGDALADAVVAELERMRRAARTHVEETYRRRNADPYAELRKRQLETRAFSALDLEETESIELEVKRLAERLRGRQSVRRKRRRRGELDLRRTLRRAQSTGGVPFSPVLRRRRRDKPKLVILCDVSDSVRAAARFLLLFVYAVQELFAATRTFVFVSEIGETTTLFREHPVARAIQLAYGGTVIPVASNSNYGRALGAFVERYPTAIDRRTTVLIVGDGRNNYHDPNVAALRLLEGRAGRIVWLNPEARGAWGFGDSAMALYKKHCAEVHTVHNLETLRVAVDRIVPR